MPRKSGEYDEQKKRINAILEGVPNDSESPDAARAYLKHLDDHLEFPCRVTGREDFPWEEGYLFGHGDSDEYEKLKKTRPSHRDTYEMRKLIAEADRSWARMVMKPEITALVRRISDGREFWIGLSWLVAMDKRSSNHQLIEDYANWLVNY